MSVESLLTRMSRWVLGLPRLEKPEDPIVPDKPDLEDFEDEPQEPVELPPVGGEDVGEDLPDVPVDQGDIEDLPDAPDDKDDLEDLPAAPEPDTDDAPVTVKPEDLDMSLEEIMDIAKRFPVQPDVADQVPPQVVGVAPGPTADLRSLQEEMDELRLQISLIQPEEDDTDTGDVTGEQDFTAMVTGHTAVGQSPNGSDSQWTYTIERAEKTDIGYGVDKWTTDGEELVAFNLNENINADVVEGGVFGNGVKEAELDVGDTGTDDFTLQPIPNGTPVLVRPIAVDKAAADGEFWIVGGGVPNGITGECP